MITGEHIVHSIYLQTLCLLAVGLGLDRVLCLNQGLPHHGSVRVDETGSLYSWLSNFAIAIRAADSLATRTPFHESFTVAYERSEVDTSTKHRAQVCSRMCVSISVHVYVSVCEPSICLPSAYFYLCVFFCFACFQCGLYCRRGLLTIL